MTTVDDGPLALPRGDGIEIVDPANPRAWVATDAIVHLEDWR
jgi:hypothetical protein